MAYASASRTTSEFGRRSAAGIGRPGGRALFMAIPGGRAFAWVVVFSIAVNLLLLVLPFYSIQVFDRVITSGSVETLIGLTVLAVAAIGFSACFEVLRNRLLGCFAVGLEQFLAPLVLKASIIDPTRRGEGSTHDMVRVRELRNTLASSTACTLLDAPFLPLFIIVLYLIHPWYGTIALVGALLLLLLAIASGRVARAERAQASGAAIRAQRTLDGIVRHGNLVRAMGWTHGAIREFVQLNNRALAPVVRANDRIGLIASIARMIRIVLQIAAVGAGAWLVLNDEVLVGSMMASSIIISRTLAPVEHLVASLRVLSSAREAWAQVGDAAAAAALDQRRTLLPLPLGALEVSAVTCRNPNAQAAPALSGVSFRLPAGERRRGHRADRGGRINAAAAALGAQCQIGGIDDAGRCHHTGAAESAGDCHAAPARNVRQGDPGLARMQAMLRLHAVAGNRFRPPGRADRPRPQHAAFRGRDHAAGAA
ncbi:hypothetical protein BTHI11S_00576 [Bosea thiooxidans]